MLNILSKYKELILYLFFGALTFLVSISTYYLFYKILLINDLIANIFSWIIAVSFAFLTNRLWVFNAHVLTLQEFLGQMIKFYSGRLFTLALEELILLIFVIILTFPSMLVKIIAQIIVIILNYIISKKIIFN